MEANSEILFSYINRNFFQQLYNTVDTIIVGQYVGTQALAAVGSTGNLISLLVDFFVGLSSGTTVLIAQFLEQIKNIVFLKLFIHLLL